MFSFKKNLLYIFSLTAVLVSSSLFINAQSSELELTGYAWSSNIGWISFNCSNDNICETSDYKVTYNQNNGNLSGYAWSSNIGWIKFGGLSSFPTGTNTTSSNATFEEDLLVGWARADSRGDSWDGWISLSGGVVDSFSLSCSSDELWDGNQCQPTTYSDIEENVRQNTSVGGGYNYGAQCPGGWRVYSQQTTGTGRNHGSRISGNGCYAWEGSKNYGSPGCRAYCYRYVDVEKEFTCPGGQYYNGSSCECPGNAPNWSGSACYSSGTSNNGVASGSYNVFKIDNKISGSAWGSDVVGWISFSGNGYGVEIRPDEIVANCSLDVDGDDRTAAFGESVEFSVNASGGDGTYNYQWYEGRGTSTDSIINGETDATYSESFDKDGVYAFTVEVSNDDGDDIDECSLGVSVTEDGNPEYTNTDNTGPAINQINIDPNIVTNAGDQCSVIYDVSGAVQCSIINSQGVVVYSNPPVLVGDEIDGDIDDTADVDPGNSYRLVCNDFAGNETSSPTFQCVLNPDFSEF